MNRLLSGERARLTTQTGGNAIEQSSVFIRLRRRVSGRGGIDDYHVDIISAVRNDNKRERLYFEIEDGLLRRRISYTDTIVGTIPEQTDFEDYREVEGLKLPFAIRTLLVDPRFRSAASQFTEIKLNPPMDQSKFDKPLPKNPTTP
jgi:hypothetical protein